jgi:hypothetical protein
MNLLIGWLPRKHVTICYIYLESNLDSSAFKFIAYSTYRLSYPGSTMHNKQKRHLLRIPHRNRPLGKPRSRWEENNNNESQIYGP